MPEDTTFEALLTLPDKAYQLKTGKRLLFIPLKNYETYSNVAGWQ